MKTSAPSIDPRMTKIQAFTICTLSINYKKTNANETNMKLSIFAFYIAKLHSITL